MAKVLLTKQIEFSASHRYHNDAWDAARNRSVFGACNHLHGHGHNYLLQVTVGGEVDEETGMVVNLFDLKQVLIQALEEFDHKHLNLDTPYFKHRVPTTENVAGVLWKILSAHPQIGTLERIRLFEDEDLYADITPDSGSDQQSVQRACLTRRYDFSAAHRVWCHQLPEADNNRLFGKCSHPGTHGHNYLLYVTVQGEIHPETGMITDIPALDRVVHERVIQRFAYANLNEDPEFSAGGTTGENLARFIWNLLIRSIPAGRLARIGLAVTPDASYEYRGTTL
ncbi:MAG: 6-pyruvoyl tetrahydropterin synthase [Nitrospiraceae bacterium]